jgi:hypothetical protein
LLVGVNVSMAKKNHLKEVKGFGKSKIQNLYAYSEDWEVGVGTGDSWGYLTEDNFSGCMEALSPYINKEVKAIMTKELCLSYPKWSGDLLKELEKRICEKEVEIVKTCLQVGECKGKGWLLRSQRTQEQCEWMAGHGYPIVVELKEMN